MRKDTKMTINLELDKDYIEEVKKVMADEFKIASVKWGVELNTDNEMLVIDNSLKQVQRKVSEMAKIRWDRSDVLTIKVTSARGAGTEITLPAEDADASPTSLIYTKDGWEVDQEKRDESVRFADFKDHIQNFIMESARTAVFYGVASFAQ